jgi:hypothetical protein
MRARQSPGWLIVDERKIHSVQARAGGMTIGVGNGFTAHPRAAVPLLAVSLFCLGIFPANAAAASEATIIRTTLEGTVRLSKSVALRTTN